MADITPLSIAPKEETHAVRRSVTAKVARIRLPPDTVEAAVKEYVAARLTMAERLELPFISMSVRVDEGDFDGYAVALSSEVIE